MGPKGTADKGKDPDEDERDTDESDTERSVSPEVDTAPADTVVPSSGLRKAVENAAVGKPTQRAHVRIPYHLKVTVYGEKEFTAGVVQNLSAQGAMIAAWQPLDVDSRVEFEIDIEGRMLPVKGVVRWNRKRRAGPLRRGMGVEFTEMAPEDRDALQQFIAKQLAQETGP